MHVRPIFLRISKYLGKAILGLLLALLTIVFLIHIPLVQGQLTGVLSDYLSSKIETRVEIQRVRFSIFGNVTIEGLEVWDPGKNKILSARNIKFSSSIPNLIFGDYIFDDLQIKGLTGQLIQHREGLNIQFIIDAFTPVKKSTGTSQTVRLQFKNILLENIKLEFTSKVNGTTVAVELGKFIGNDAEFSTLPDKIIANKLFLEQTSVNVLSTYQGDTTTRSVNPTDTFVINPDFGTGIAFDIHDLEMRGNNFDFHRNDVQQAPKFNTNHLSIKNIHLNLSDILIRNDTLAGTLKSLSGNLPGFEVDEFRTAIRMNRNRLNLSDLHLVSNTNELNADFTGSYHFDSAQVQPKSDIDVNVSARISPRDLTYFFSDSIMNYFKNWETTVVGINGNYSLGKGELKTLNLKTGNSTFHATGKVYDIWDLKKLNWRDVVIHTNVGPDFKKILSPFLGRKNIPPDVTMDVKSYGDTKKINLDANVFTTWGNVETVGFVTRRAAGIGIDAQVTGKNVVPGAWLELPWLGPLNLSVDAQATIGDNPEMEIKGLISSVEIMDQTINSIALQSSLTNDSLATTLSVKDPLYRSEIRTGILLSSPYRITGDLQFDKFHMGRLLHLDSTLSISGDLKSEIKIDQTTIDGYVVGNHVLLNDQSTEYLLDSMVFDALISPTASDISYYSDTGKGTVVSNFDIRDLPDLLQKWSGNIPESGNLNNPARETRTLNFDLELKHASLLQLMKIQVEDFSLLRITGALDEQKQTAALQAASGRFKGYGLALDTLQANLITVPDSAGGGMWAKNLSYDTIQLGNLDIDLITKGDTTVSNLKLENDSLSILRLGTRILPTDTGVFVYPDTLQLFEYEYVTDRNNPLYIEKGNMSVDNFRISRDSMNIRLDGDMNTFDASIKNADLTLLNYLLSPDTTLINNGHLSGILSYSRYKKLDLNANIDNLILYHSNPLAIAVTAETEGNLVPFDFQLTNASNKIDLNGQYFLNTSALDASLVLDVNNLELFAFLVSDVIDDMHGTIKGEAKISGALQRPVVNGSLRFLDMGLTTVNPKLTFTVPDDIITLDNTGLLFKDFRIYDAGKNPLTINGNLTTKDYSSFAYDLHLNTENYILINHPDSSSGRLRGLLVVDSDIRLVGNEKDTEVKATVALKDTSNLTFVIANNDIEMLKTEGIIEFIDPQLMLDTLAEQSSDFYDSLIASLPDFKLNSTIKIEEDAVLRVLIDEQSGDYIETSGGANLELDYDRTGNARLSGDYIIKEGVYRLSFYDLVKKNFQLVKGSSINWSGSPENGVLDIKAVHTVESNSIGLIGHEIGENEKSIYKRSLDYEVGIIINGTLEKPIVSFSLDLPQREKANYPVLANKLDRLRQPEYESELNKQVFGLLVLGGFLPETSGADINSNLIATTALSNSVNSLLASQLNRFASQYIKGVNIDVGIQSYSDYSAPGGKTKTAMDFRVSKRIMNDRLSFEIGGDFDINQDQSGTNTGTKNFRGDIAIIYDLTGRGDKQLKLFNNESYDIIYQEIRNTGISIVFIREFASKEKRDK
jgi:hypothetical protein